MQIVVFGAQNNGIDPRFQVTAAELGRWIAENNHSLLYGGESSGLIHSAICAAKAAGGMVARVDASSSDKLIHRGDACVILPGGIEVFNNAMHIIRLCDEGSCTCPVVLLNIADFWEPLKTMMDRMESEQYLVGESLNVFFCDSVDAVSKMIN